MTIKVQQPVILPNMNENQILGTISIQTFSKVRGSSLKNWEEIAGQMTSSVSILTFSKVRGSSLKNWEEIDRQMTYPIRDII
jgi:hypothetical protein